MYANVPAGFATAVATLIAGNGTAARVLIDQQLAAVATGTTPQFYGGGTIVDATASSTDSASHNLELWLANILTTVGAGTGSVTTTTSTIPRSSGSWIADGWNVGDLVMTFAPIGTALNSGVDGTVGVVTAVTALTLTLSGTPIAALALATGTRVCRVSSLFVAPVAANSGTNGTLASVNLVNSATDGSVLRAERKFGVNDLIAVSSATAVSAAPAYVSVQAQFAKY